MTQWYCVAPFRQAYLDVTGVSSCCRMSRQNTSLDQWHKNSTLLQIQKEFLEGKIPSSCQGCINEEKMFGTSLRIQNNQDYDNKIFTDTKIEFIDYRSSNLCNFKCRMCSPLFSHKIAKEVDDNPTILSNYFSIKENKFLQVDENNIQWIVENINQIQRLMFTGGEPTVMPNVRLILEYLIENKLTDIPILITTNGSFTDNFWKDIVTKFSNLHWTVSIDATGVAAEIIRYGTDWSTVEKNVRWLAENAGSVMINTVITNLNIFHLQPLLKLVRSLQIENKDKNNGLDHHFHISRRPYYLSADNLTNHLKKTAIEHVSDCLSLDLSESSQQILQGLLNLLKSSEFDKNLWDRSCAYNFELDRIRNQDHTQLFPKQ